jgi:hypothetical protein
MTAGDVQKVIARAVSDAGFRELLFRNPGDALAGYDLTAEERATILGGLSREGFDASASDLGERVSRAGVHLDDFVGELVDVLGLEEAPAPGERIGHEEPEPPPEPPPPPESEVGVAMPADPDVNAEELRDTDIELLEMTKAREITPDWAGAGAESSEPDIGNATAYKGDIGEILTEPDVHVEGLESEGYVPLHAMDPAPGAADEPPELDQSPDVDILDDAIDGEIGT